MSLFCEYDLGKNNPLNENDLKDFIELFKLQKETRNSWFSNLEKIEKDTLDISVKNPNIVEIVDNGFFISDILLKLGIVGTVIGFIIMLSSLSTIDEMNLSKMNNLLLSMSGGMKVALYTTLSGLIGSILLTFQNNFFENKINAFISEIINSCHDEKKN